MPSQPGTPAVINGPLMVDCLLSASHEQSSETGNGMYSSSWLFLRAHLDNLNVWFAFARAAIQGFTALCMDAIRWCLLNGMQLASWVGAVSCLFGWPG